MLLQGNFYVRSKEFGKGKDKRLVYSTTIANTYQDEKVYAFLNVQFSNKAQDKLSDLGILCSDEETQKINVKEAWLSPYKKADGSTTVKIFVNDFDFEEDEEEHEDAKPQPKANKSTKNSKYFGYKDNASTVRK